MSKKYKWNKFNWNVLIPQQVKKLRVNMVTSLTQKVWYNSLLKVVHFCLKDKPLPMIWKS